MAEAHTTPLLGHVRQPETPLLRLAPTLDDCLDPVVAFPSVLVGLTLERAHFRIEEVAHPGPDLFDMGRECEVNGHVRIFAPAA